MRTDRPSVTWQYLAAVAVILGWMAGLASAHVGRQLPIYELPDTDLPDLHDGSFEDWEDVLPGQSLDQGDTEAVDGIGDASSVDARDLAFRVYLAWNLNRSRLYVGLERVDDAYVNTFGGRDPAAMALHDGVQVPDVDARSGELRGFYNLEGQSTAWRDAARFADGELLACDYGDCDGLGSAPGSSSMPRWPG